MIFLPWMIPQYQTFQLVRVAHQKPLNYLGAIVNIYSCFLWKCECCCTVLVTPWIFFLASYDLSKHFKPWVVCTIMQVWPNVSPLFSLWSFPPWNIKRETRENSPHVMESAVSNVCEASLISLFLAPQRTQWITGNAFRISFHPDWQMNNEFFNRPIIACTEILLHSWGPRTRISALFRRPT